LAGLLNVLFVSDVYIQKQFCMLYGFRGVFQHFQLNPVDEEDIIIYLKAQGYTRDNAILMVKMIGINLSVFRSAPKTDQSELKSKLS